MDKNLLEEIIEDYERMLGIISNRLNQLKALSKGGKVNVRNDSIRDQIEAKKREVMAQINTMRGASINRSKKNDG